MKNPQPPLNSREELAVLTADFYAKVRADGLIGPVFAHVNWDEHLPKITSFWEDLLFGTDHYRGRPFPPHMKLNLKIEHFNRWLQLFFATVDEHFAGLKAEEIKARALRIAHNFAANLGLDSTPRVT